MRRIRLFIEYDGTNYAGWQRQANALTVQEAIEDNLLAITGEQIVIHGSGRTDARVHALAQVAHFDTSVRMDAVKFANALNSGLPKDIRIWKSEEVSPGFHARFSAKRKHYRYTIDNAEHASALFRNYRLHLHSPLNVEAMRVAAKAVEGTHDFCAFRATASTIKNTVRTIYRSEITQEGSIIHYDVEGNGFLYNMVRIIVGTLIEIGMGKYPIEHMAEVIASQKRNSAGATAPPHGLTLVRVEYPVSEEEQQNRADRTLAENQSLPERQSLSEEEKSLPNTTAQDWMFAALAEAEKAYIEGEIPVGAVVVRNGEILAQAHNTREKTGDPTAHAEILALRLAAERVGDWRLNDCTLYVTLEPCPMCAGAIVNSRIGRVVFGAFDAQFGCCGSHSDFLTGQYGGSAKAIGGILKEDCEALLKRRFEGRR